MEEKTIELEFRAEISPKGRNIVHDRLKKLGKFYSCTRRLSVMCFGVIESKKIDIRIRVTNRKCEVVVKSGSFGAHDRIEVAQPISHGQFLGFVKIFTRLGFNTKIGERETFNYELPNNVIVSFVFAGTIAYIEIEKMSSPSDVGENTKQLKKIANSLGLQLMKSEEEFDNLCNRLDREVDRPFHDSEEEYAKLSKLFNSYVK